MVQKKQGHDRSTQSREYLHVRQESHVEYLFTLPHDRPDIAELERSRFM
jgi:hypothetical protein